MYQQTNKPAPSRGGRQLVVSLPVKLPPFIRRASNILAIVAITHFASQLLSREGIAFSPGIAASYSAPDALYLLDRARPYVEDAEAFATRVIDIAADLDVPPEWLMAVMYAESKFDPGIANYKGSGAVGLIQFMPSTALDLGTSSERLQRMKATQQLEYVYEYLQRVARRSGPYESLTDLYLGILFPKARGQDYCYTLFAKPSTSYTQNSGLDEDKDGRVTVSDVDKHLRGLFPEAYVAGMEQSSRRVQ